MGYLYIFLQNDGRRNKLIDKIFAGRRQCLVSGALQWVKFQRIYRVGQKVGPQSLGHNSAKS